MTEPGVDKTWTYLGFGQRVVATVIDLLLQTLLLIPIVIVYFPNLLNEPEPSQSFQWVAGLVQTAVLIGFWLSAQSTPGKMLFKAKIVDAETGAKPSGKQFALRYLGYIVGSLALGLGFLWAAFDKRNQGWHDKMAGTVVVKSVK
jgi:uncharacterized RDD family membrane protein YckC